MNVKEIMPSKYFKGIIIIVGVLIVALLSFSAGIAVGIHKAKFSYAWGQNYEQNFVGGRGNMIRDERGRERMIPQGGSMMNRFGIAEKLSGRDFRNAHGIAGIVLSVSDTSIIVIDRDNKENTITITEGTLIKRNNESITLGDIAKDDNVVVVGKPDDNGVVKADFIRVFKQGNNQ
ncbi:MAG: hypothetical protein PHH40_04270 [Candidatus Moranbacteria bacterium]|nr:hypothetical protein [Candidatus Moranbacteria bacterium]MDD3964547.1 hypothetical protein [Candidatus Moranbacteria bacterium]